MKKIVPFNNVLTFSTDVCEITAISLEHDIKTDFDSISGTFYISGEYKITDGQLDKEKFNFELPFDIALGNEYNLDTLVVDIDDFRYELVERNKLKVNIDLFIDGELLIQEDNDDKEVTNEISKTDEESMTTIPIKEIEVTEDDLKTNQTIDDIREDDSNLLTDMLDTKEDDKEMNEININNENNNENENENINFWSSNNFEDKYVTYKVYRVVEGDTIDKILEKYTTTKDELSKYNDITEIHVGDKLIIPYNDK